MAFELPRNHPCRNPNANVFEILGWFLTEFTILENVLKILLIRSIKSDLQAGYFLVARLDAKALPSKIRAALKQTRRISEDLKALLLDIERVANIRNELCHCAPSFDDKYSKIQCHGFGVTLAGGDVPSKTYSANQLRHLAYYAGAAALDILNATDCLLLGQTASTASLAKAAFPHSPPIAGQFDQGIPHTLAQKPVEEALARREQKARELAEYQRTHGS